ncbi:DUF5615 family PIN-like protein [Marivirga sp.]|uniref:DUF5615 family PIN-like protein n=1 Tax=Marivirga sp. TaxID=2018662 RepID=UPI0025FDB36C|nr:DUF5615 family PIN-like protein [Marivirga sp.]
MKFLANENIPLTSVNYLKSNGYDIIAIGIDNSGVSDEEVMKIAINQRRTILTYDSDYGKLIFEKGHKPDEGVIYFRNQPETPLDTAKSLENLLKNESLDYKNTLTVIDSNSIRQRKY